MAIAGRARPDRADRPETHGVPDMERVHVGDRLRPLDMQDRGDLSVLRPLFEEFMLQTPLPSDVSLTEPKLGGVPALEISMPEATTDAALLYFHGGVFALGSARASAGLACLIARQARANVLSVERSLRHVISGSPSRARRCSTHLGST